MKKQTHITIERNGKSEVIPCYLQLSQVYKDPNKNSWKARRTMNGKRPKFSSSEIFKESAHRDINRQIHDYIREGKRTEIKRNEHPPIVEVVNAMLASPYTDIEVKESTRFDYSTALRKITEHLPGKEPNWEWTDATNTVRLYKPGSKWDKIKVNEITPVLVRGFRGRYMKGLTPDSEPYNVRGRGANGILKSAKAVFGKKLMDIVYKPLWNMPELKEFKKMLKMSVADKEYTAPRATLMDSLIAKADLLKEQCIDTWLTFELSYSVGLRWGEIRHAMYSWFYPEQIRNMAGELVTSYVCHIQATKDWSPKHHSTGKVKISKQLYDDIMATKGLSRERMQLSPPELERLVWSRPSTEVAKELGYTNEGLGKMCSRLGISKPRAAFWKKVAAGMTPHPQGRPVEGYRIWNQGDQTPANVVSMDKQEKDERLLKRYNGAGNNHSSANRRLARWFKKNGWNRQRVAHEMRAYNGAMITTLTGNLYEAQKRLRHKSVRTTEKYYADLIAPSDVAINLPSSEVG